MIQKMKCTKRGCINRRIVEVSSEDDSPPPLCPCCDLPLQKILTGFKRKRQEQETTDLDGGNNSLNKRIKLTHEQQEKQQPQQPQLPQQQQQLPQERRLPGQQLPQQQQQLPQERRLPGQQLPQQQQQLPQQRQLQGAGQPPSGQGLPLPRQQQSLLQKLRLPPLRRRQPRMSQQQVGSSTSGDGEMAATLVIFRKESEYPNYQINFCFDSAKDTTGKYPKTVYVYDSVLWHKFIGYRNLKKSKLYSCNKRKTGNCTLTFEIKAQKEDGEWLIRYNIGAKHHEEENHEEENNHGAHFLEQLTLSKKKLILIPGKGSTLNKKNSKSAVAIKPAPKQYFIWADSTTYSKPAVSIRTLPAPKLAAEKPRLLLW